MNNNDIINSPDYVEFIVEYTDNLVSKIKNNEDIYIISINSRYASIYIKADLLSNFMDSNEVINLLKREIDENIDRNILFIASPQIYTLEQNNKVQQISSITASGVSLIQVELPLKLTGKGVMVGIIDTGIDYLNEEFMDQDGKSRIISIWDQTIGGIDSGGIVPFGTIYSRDEINKAIELKRQGGDPYSIVPSRDVNGHGTNMAGAVGATGKNKEIKGIAPECEFIIVKLSEERFLKKKQNIQIPIFSLASIMFAIEYLNKMLFSEKKPITILLPLGSNNGNHKGDSIFSSYIENISSNSGIVIVTGTGNEALREGHVSGMIRERNKVESIGLLVDEKQKDLLIEFWGDLPNIFDISIVSPTGQESGFIPAVLNLNKSYTFISEKTKVHIHYFLPEQYTGDELISIYFENIFSGLWMLKLKLNQGRFANYNAWISQKGIALPGTKFTPSDPYGTMTVPSESDYVITVAAYNQNNNSILPYSGVSFREEDSAEKIDFAAGGENTNVVGLNNTIDIISGSSLAAAIGAGACILLFQWGIIEGNYPNMYIESMQTFLRRGIIQLSNLSYPNPNLGYGIINFYRIFQNMT